MPLSAARQSANAANAWLSTGPRTTDSKSRSSQNAREHGLTAEDLVIGPEDRQEFDELLTRLQAYVSPQGALQQILFDELVAGAWNLRRIRRTETELCAGAATYEDLLNDEDIQMKLDRLARHKSRIERMIPLHIRGGALPLASAIEIAKRTQAPGAAPILEILLEALGQELEGVELEWTAPDVAAATAGG